MLPTKHPPSTRERLIVAILDAIDVMERYGQSDCRRAAKDLNHAFQEWREWLRKRES